MSITLSPDLTISWFDALLFGTLAVLIALMGSFLVSAWIWDHLISDKHKRAIKKKIHRAKYLWKTRKGPKVVLWSSRGVTALVLKGMYDEARRRFLAESPDGDLEEMRLPDAVLFMNFFAWVRGLPNTFWLMDETTGTSRDLERLIEGCQVHRLPFAVPYDKAEVPVPAPETPPMHLKDAWKMVWGNRRKFDGQFDDCSGYRKAAV